MTELSAKTFDVAEMFSGVAYPTSEVAVYMNARVGAEYSRLTEEALAAVQAEDEEAGKRIEARRKELLAEAEKSRFIFHLRGQSRERINAIRDQVEEEYPVEYDFLGREKPNRAGDEKYTDLIWALHIERIERPDGAILTAPTESDIRVIRNNAPDSESKKITNAIQEFSTSVQNGIEAIAQEHDFLSSAS